MRFTVLSGASVCLHLPRYVFSKNIKLHIHLVARNKVFEIRVLPGIRNDRDREQISMRRNHRQTHSIKANRAFIHQQTTMLRAESE